MKDTRKSGEPNRNPTTGTAIGGPAGTVIGAGKGVAELVDPTLEESYWREVYRTESYYTDGRDWAYYQPAYRAGWEGRLLYDGKSFEDVEYELASDYKRYCDYRKDTSWDEVRPATRAAWDRVDARVQSATRN